MNLYIVEDEFFQLEDLKITLEELGHNCVGHSDDPFEAQEQIGQSGAEAVLMDIHLHGKLAGIALARRVKALCQLPIIFTSSDRNITVMEEAADVAPVAYLTKPINPGDLQAALILAQKQIVQASHTTEAPNKTIFVKNGNKLVKVAMEDILFAHTDTKNYCTLVTVQNQKLTFRNSILAFYKLLDPKMFIQTHRSYLVNLQQIDCIHENDQTIEIQGHHVPVGRTFKAALYERMKVL